MKKKSLGFLLLVATLIFFSSCQKVIDRIPEEPKLTKTEILTKSTWKLNEVLRNIEGTNSHYIRDSINDTQTDYDKIRMGFNVGGTGTYVDEVGISHTLNWRFTTSDERNMELIIGPPSATTFVWNIVEISDSSLTNTTAFGPSILVSARYVPIDEVK